MNIPPGFSATLTQRRPRTTKRYYPRPRVKPYRGKGEHAKRYWRAEWHSPPDATGKRQHRVETWPQDEYTRVEAQAACDRIVRYECSGTRPDGATRLCDYWEKTYWPIKREHLAITSRRQYESNYKNHLVPIHELPLTDITRHDVQSIMVQMAKDGYGESTCGVVLALVSGILDEAYQSGHIRRNPAHGVEVPRSATRKRPTRSLTADEATRLLACLDASERLLWATLVLTGARISEAFGLRPADLLPSRRLRIERQSVYGGTDQEQTKNRKSRTVAVPAGLWRELQALARRSTGHLFPAPTGGAQYRQSRAVAVMLEGVRQRSGIADLTFRMCRTTFATLYPGDVADVQAQVGHHSAEFTVEHYRREIPERQQAAADALEASLRPRLRRVK